MKRTSFFEYPVTEILPLPRPKITTKSTFINVLKSRQSERNFSKLSLDQISSILWYSAKVKKVVSSHEGYILTTRNSPSAGSIHPIDIFVSFPNTVKKRDIYYYNPFVHTLARLNVNQSALTLFFTNINSCLNCKNATIIWFGAYPSIVNARYKNPESLIWRDAGVLLMTVHLTASALSINSCPVGTLGEPYFSKMMNKQLHSVGGILIG